jgi:hypothetical protein
LDDVVVDRTFNNCPVVCDLFRLIDDLADASNGGVSEYLLGERIAWDVAENKE